MNLVFLGILAGYCIGTLLALTLDRWYTGVSLRGPVALCADGSAPVVLWAGTLGFLLVSGTCPSGCRLPARLWYLPLIGAAAGGLIAARSGDARHAALLAIFATLLTALA